MLRAILRVFVVVLVLSGCASTPAFREATKNQPHATLRFEAFMGIGNAFLVEEINGQPASAWKLTHHQFIVPPGHYVLLLKNCEAPKYGYIASAMVKLDAEADRTYLFTRNVTSDSVVVTATRDDGEVMLSEKMALDPGFCD